MEPALRAVETRARMLVCAVFVSDIIQHRYISEMRRSARTPPCQEDAGAAKAEHDTAPY